jgi:hypothetical protein
MDELDVIKFAEANLERIAGPHGGPAYRCAATLTDGVHLPCVLIASVDSQLELALRRFEETRLDGLKPKAERRFGHGMTYPDIVKTFTASNNCVRHFDIASLEPSRFVIPLARLGEVRGETSMSWTQFSVTMRDGAEFGFGTSFLMEFFDMPDGYSGDDIVSVHQHRAGPGRTYRERPYFSCYVRLT